MRAALAALMLLLGLSCGPTTPPPPPPTSTTTTTTVAPTTTTEAPTTTVEQTTTTEATTTTLDVGYLDAQCRENGPGRVHAINDVNAYESAWSEATKAAVVIDAQHFVDVCGPYPRTGDLIAASRVLLDCFAVTPAAIGACYNPPGNEISDYLHQLLVSSG